MGVSREEESSTLKCRKNEVRAVNDVLTVEDNILPGTDQTSERRPFGGTKLGLLKRIHLDPLRQYVRDDTRHGSGLEFSLLDHAITSQVNDVRKF